MNAQIAAATPAAVEDFWHVGGDTIVDVPAGCCEDVAVVNASAVPDGGTTAPAIAVRNLNVKISRIAA